MAKEKDMLAIVKRIKWFRRSFWNRLRSTELKNAARVDFEKDKVGFEMLRTMVRAA